MIKINVPSQDYFFELKTGKTIEIGVQFAEKTNIDFLQDDRLEVAFGGLSTYYDEFDIQVRRIVDVPRVRIKLLHKVSEKKLQEEIENQQLKMFEETNAKLDKALQETESKEDAK